MEVSTFSASRSFYFYPEICLFLHPDLSFICLRFICSRVTTKYEVGKKILVKKDYGIIDEITFRFVQKL